MVKHSKISVGEKVYFLVYKFDAKNERKKLYKKGIVVARYDNILHIESRKKTYKIEQAKVYPLGCTNAFRLQHVLGLRVPMYPKKLIFLI